MVSLNLRDSVFTGESIPVALKTSVVMVRRHPDHLSLVARCLITVAFCGLAATGSELSMSQDFQTSPQSPPRTHDPFLYAMIRALGGIGPTHCSRHPPEHPRRPRVGPASVPP